jgi:ubiquinone/menaquinone biosynthesis C-methylase UbiE
LTQAQLEQVIDAAVTKGWEVALHDRLRTIDPAIYRQSIDEYRAQWRFVVPLLPSNYVLDLSCGWGAIAFNFAETCALVVAADACSEHVRFVALRARQKDQTNLVPLQLGLDRPLPFSPKSFDVVVLADALSWLVDRELQRLLLQRIYSVLTTGGSILLADSNRLTGMRLAQ